MARAGANVALALIVEDDPLVRSLAVALLEETELGVVEVESAEAALSMMQRSGGDIALVFADIRLPGGMDGADLARVVTKLWPCTRVVLTSGDPGDRTAAIPENVAYLPKPWRGLEVLVQAHQAVSSPPPPIA